MQRRELYTQASVPSPQQMQSYNTQQGGGGYMGGGMQQQQPQYQPPMQMQYSGQQQYGMQQQQQQPQYGGAAPAPQTQNYYPQPQGDAKDTFDPYQAHPQTQIDAARAAGNGSPPVYNAGVQQHNTGPQQQQAQMQAPQQQQQVPHTVYVQQPQYAYPAQHQMQHHQQQQQFQQPQPQQQQQYGSTRGMSSTPVIQQPGATQGMTVDVRNMKNVPRKADGEREWSNGLCDCFDDCGTCCLAYFCPCLVYSQIKSRLAHLETKGYPHPEGGDMTGSDCCVHCCLTSCGWGWVLQIGTRSAIRNHFRISGDGCSDCLTAWCCTPCELTQESREIELEEKALLGSGPSNMSVGTGKL